MAETLPEIREDAAPAETLAIYAAIRDATGLPVISFVWRHLAAMPGALPWAWDAVRPAIRAGLVASAAERVSAGLRLPAEPPLERVRLAEAGVHEAAAHGGVPAIRAVIDAYNRYNAKQLVAVTALLRGLESGFPPGRTGGTASAAAVEQVAMPALPPLPRLDDLDERARRAVEGLASEHPNFVAAGAVPSLYLHLGHWPGFVELVRDRIRRLHLADLRDAACLLAESESATLLAGMTADPPPAAVRAEIERALARFARGLVPEMVAAGLVLRRALPG